MLVLWGKKKKSDTPISGNSSKCQHCFPDPDARDLHEPKSELGGMGLWYQSPVGTGLEPEDHTLFFLELPVTAGSPDHNHR